MNVDLNADLGESFGQWTMGSDDRLIGLMTSVNIACGMHAGDPSVMDRTVRLAKQAGVSIGAHPAFHDLQGFGRRAVSMRPDETESLILYQIGALFAFVRAHEIPLSHVKPHGALYNMAAADLPLALAVCRAVARFDSSVICCGPAGSRLEEAAAACGLRFCSEVFADRGYLADGSLAPRGSAGAFIEDAQVAAERVVRMIRSGTVTAVDGSEIAIRAQTVCLHGDSPQAVDFAILLRNRLIAEGIGLVPMSKLV